MTPGARLLFAARQAASPFAARPTAPQSPAHRRRLQRAALAALAIVVLGGGGTPARAETSATFGVAARIDAGCLVDGLGSSGDAGTMGTLDFGSDMSLSTATHTASASAAQTIRLRCTPGTALLMTIDGGEHEAGGVRYLQHGADSGARIAYSLCSDGSCAAPIAVGAATPVTVLDANSEDIRLPLYGRLTLPGALPPGLYNDRLLVTLSW